MTIKARRWNLLVTATGLAGITLLTTRHDPALAGLLTGAALTGLVAILIVERRLAELAHRASELDASRAQYEAAHAALSGQRERMRISLESEFEERLTEANSQLQHDLLRARMEGYIEGATHAVNGRLAPAQSPEAEIISLADRRAQPPTVDAREP